MELKGKAALVTGGATGIGRATVLRLARAGASSVAINYRSAKAEAEKLAAEVRQMGGQALCVNADVKRDEQVRQMVQKIADDFGRLDILVNNAGITRWVDLCDLESLSDEVWDEILDVNVKGAFRCTRAAAKLLAQNEGVVVNVSSISGIVWFASTNAMIVWLPTPLATHERTVFAWKSLMSNSTQEIALLPWTTPSYSVRFTRFALRYPTFSVSIVKSTS